jgi:hypothetical protein
MGRGMYLRCGREEFNDLISHQLCSFLLCCGGYPNGWPNDRMYAAIR